MYTIKEGLSWNKIIEFYNLYEKFVDDFKQKAKIFDDNEKIADELVIIRYALLNPFFTLKDRFIILYENNSIIGFQCINLDIKETSFKQATFGALYISPEHRKIITIDDKTTYSVAHLRDFAYNIMDNENVTIVHTSTHKLLIKNILMYLREGFIPYKRDTQGIIDMVKDRQYRLPKEELYKLTNELKNTGTVPLIDVHSNQYSLKFKNKSTK